jgi:hypothetical protein
MEFTFDWIGILSTSGQVGRFILLIPLNRSHPFGHPNEFPARMYIMLAGIGESRMIENCPLTKRRDCNPGA